MKAEHLDVDAHILTEGGLFCQNLCLIICTFCSFVLVCVAGRIFLGLSDRSHNIDLTKYSYFHDSLFASH